MRIVLFLLFLFCTTSVYADDCSAGKDITYPSDNQPPAIETWGQDHLSSAPTGPTCAKIQPTDFTDLVAVTGSFPSTDDAAAIISRFGAISTLKGNVYWSTTDQKWQTLILNASALDDSNPKHTRSDFKSDELTAGKSLSFFMRDNRFSNDVVYQLHVDARSDDKFVITISNVSNANYMRIAFLNPKEIQTVYYLQRLSPTSWGYYSLSGVHEHQLARLAGDHTKSNINRAIAMYRHIAGIPTGQEPPAAK